MRTSENPKTNGPDSKYLLEISVQTLEAAEAAQRGGADRIELCAELSVGGVTPSAELMEKVRAAMRIPIFSMIRPRAGDFVYLPGEFAEMAAEIEKAKELGMDGVVLGILTPQQRVDVERSRELVARARPMTVTYHRALDSVDDLDRGIEDVISTGAVRVLTSGGAKTVVEGAAKLRTLLHIANERITVMPGAGIHPGNFRQVRELIGAREYHCGLGTVMPYGRGDLGEFERAVSAMIAVRGREEGK